MNGYVAFKLMKKYKKAGQFVECLSSMTIEGPESSFYDYTKEWMKLVDRGGLFNINDNSFMFFMHWNCRLDAYSLSISRLHLYLRIHY